jgi:hypothetical protein
MRWLAFTRSSEWWGFKLPLFFSIGYFVILQNPTLPIFSVLLHLFILVLGLIIGALYVSVINDLTDLKDDFASNKTNRLQQISPLGRGIILSVCILLGILFVYFFLSSSISKFFYIAAWVAFSLYSIPPFRLKNKDVWGVFADACGSNVFPNLCIVAGMGEFCGIELSVFQYVFIAIWSLCYGLRGILWHQYVDVQNDLLVKINTLASKVDRSIIKKFEIPILCIEVLAFCLFNVTVGFWSVILTLLVYFIFVFLVATYQNMSNAIILVGDDKPWIFLMGSFYQSLWPILLIVLLGLKIPSFFILIPIHFLLFPQDFLSNFNIARGLILYFVKYRPR